MKRSFLFLMTGFSFLCLCCKGASAQAVPLSASQALDVQAERFRQEYSQERQLRERKTEKPSVNVEEKEESPAVPGPAFPLNAVRITGMTAVDPSRLTFIWENYLGKQIKYADLQAIARMIKRVYKDLGFLTTTTFLPPQEIKNGEVEIRVVEGKRGDLRVEGNKDFSSDSIAKYFHTFRGEPLDMGEVDKDVMRLNENQDLKVSAVLTPGAEPETVDVILKAKESRPYHVSVGTDNQGSRLTGRYRESVAFNASNLTGNHDELSVNAVFTKLSSGQFVSYRTPVGTYGTKLGMEAGFFQAKLGREYTDYDITTATQSYNPNASFELYKSQQLQMDLRTGVRIKNVEKKQDIELLTNEKLRLPYAAVDIVEIDALGQTRFSPEVSVSRPGMLGSSRRDNPLASRNGFDGTFLKYAQTVDRTQAMPFNTYMEIRSQAQFSAATLPTSEQLQLGGENSVRGYPEGDYLADTGANLNMDWHFPQRLFPSTWKIADFSFRDQIEPVLFADAGMGRLNKTSAIEKDSKFLAGVGGGFNVRIRNNAHVKMEWAKAVGNRPIHGAGPSAFYVSFQCGM